MKKLRIYQKDALDAILKAKESGNGGTIASLPPGAGKTFIQAKLAESLPSNERILYITNKIDLLNQSIDEFRDVLGDDNIGIERGLIWSKNEKIVFATIQTMHQLKRLNKFEEDTFSLIITDEAHRSPARTYRKVYDKFPDAYRVGFTATVDRHDHVGYQGIYNSICYHIDMIDLIHKGVLMSPTISQPVLNIDIRNVRITHGDFDSLDLEKIMLEGIAPLCTSIVEQAIGRTVVFAPTIASCEVIAQSLREMGLKAEAIHSKVKEKHRKALIERFKEGELTYLVNPLLLTEGFNCPIMETIVIARPTTNKSLLTQMLGRVLRTYPDKVIAQVIQFGYMTLKNVVRIEDIFLEGEDYDTAHKVREYIRNNPNSRINIVQLVKDKKEMLNEKLHIGLLQTALRRDLRYRKPIMASSALKAINCFGENVYKHKSLIHWDSVRINNTVTERQLKNLTKFNIHIDKTINCGQAAALLHTIKTKMHYGRY